jgi:hypothetical protein
LWPDDFSAEEKRFARKLRGFYSIEDENLPPLYVQTMLDNELHAPLSRDYTRQLSYRVMRQLELPRRPLASRRWMLLPEGSSLRAMIAPARRAGAPLIAALSVLMALVLGSVYLATPSFAEGLRLLLGQTGAQQIESYPLKVGAPARPIVNAKDAKPIPAMPIFWAGQTFGEYYYKGMTLLDQQDWSNGPIFDLQYSLTAASHTPSPSNAAPMVTSKNAAIGGTGLLDIREFQVSNKYGAVLQAVQDGSTQMTSVNGLPAVYVDGMWVIGQGGRTSWQSGVRSMLIFQRDGVIFWITGDQRDGLTQYSLTQVAAALTQTSLATLRPNRLSTRFSSVDPDATLGLPMGANSDLLEEIPRVDSANGATGTFVTVNLPAPSMN